jgi:serine/threonine-protein kinase
LAGLAPGSIVDGRYRVEHVLGEGGMGVVVAARHIGLGELVAIKALLPELAAQDNDALNRFSREAWAASRIRSEYVVRVSDVGTLASGMPFMVMEHLHGMDLSKLLQTRGPLPVHEAVEFVLQACEATAEAHALGVVHRDLKPSNLFCVRRSDGLSAIKVLDFGISKLTRGVGSGHDHSITTTNVLFGSPLYMSPEQMSSAKAVDVRTDIWSLGVILYELVSGEPPFQAVSLPELAVKIATTAPKPLRLKAGTPKGLERVLLRCLARDRERRYANVADFAQALIPYGPARARSHAERALRVLSAAEQPAGVAGTAMAGAAAAAMQLNESGRTRTSHIGLWLVLVGLVLGLVALGVTFALREPSAHRPNDSPPASSVAPRPVIATGHEVQPSRAALPLDTAPLPVSNVPPVQAKLDPPPVHKGSEVPVEPSARHDVPPGAATTSGTRARREVAPARARAASSEHALGGVRAQPVASERDATSAPRPAPAAPAPPATPQPASELLELGGRI